MAQNMDWGRRTEDLLQTSLVKLSPLWSPKSLAAAQVDYVIRLHGGCDLFMNRYFRAADAALSSD